MSTVSSLVSPAVQKLKIFAYSDAGYTHSISATDKRATDAMAKTVTLPSNGLSLPFNPESLSTTYGSNFRENRQIGEKTSGGKKKPDTELVFSSRIITARSFTFTLDATLPGTKDYDIANTIAVLETMCFARDNTTGEPPYLRLVWGKETYEGRATGLDVNKILFHHDGSPLRAQVTVRVAEQQREIKFDKGTMAPKLVYITTPDMPVLATLMAMMAASSVAGAAEEAIDYVQAGVDNGMDSLHALVPGAPLVFGQ